MHAEMHILLNAYLDGELHGRQLQEMETHLGTCADCQAELRELRLVSGLLQADSTIPEAAPVDRFVSQLNLSLPRRVESSLPPKRISWIWWLVPVGLLGAWAFVQTVFTLTDVVSVASLAGLLGDAFAWLGTGQEAIWLSTAIDVFGGQFMSQPFLSLLNNASIFSANLLAGFFWQAVIVVLYWAWLLFWWRRQNSQVVKVQNGSS